MRRRTAPIVAVLCALIGQPRLAAAQHPGPGAPIAGGAIERGIALGLFASDPAYDYDDMLHEIRALGATDVLIGVVWTLRDERSVRVHRHPVATASDATVERTLNQARALGLRATLFPFLRLETPTHAGAWRGTLAPAAGVAAWFAEYTGFIVTMAHLAARTQTPRLCIGSELGSLEGEGDRWRALAAAVRTVFAGKLLYSANWDHFGAVAFWDAVDAVGVSAYFELARTEAAPTDEDLAAAWAEPRAALARLRAQTGRPLVITEIGYPSMVGVARFPWDETRTAAVDVELQAQLYGAFCEAFAPAGVIDGFYFWNWFGWGGVADAGYTPRGKPAAQRAGRCLADGRWRAPAGAP